MRSGPDVARLEELVLAAATPAVLSSTSQSVNVPPWTKNLDYKDGPPQRQHPRTVPSNATVPQVCKDPIPCCRIGHSDAKLGSAAVLRQRHPTLRKRRYLCYLWLLGKRRERETRESRAVKKGVTLYLKLLQARVPDARSHRLVFK